MITDTETLTESHKSDKPYIFPYDIVNHWSILSFEEDSIEVNNHRRTLMKEFVLDAIDYNYFLLQDGDKEDKILANKDSILNKFTNKQQRKLGAELMKAFLGKKSLVDEDNSLIFEELLYTLLMNQIEIDTDNMKTSYKDNNDFAKECYDKYKEFILSYEYSEDLVEEDITPDYIFDFFYGDEHIFFDSDWEMFRPNDEVINNLKKKLNVLKISECDKVLYGE